MRDDSRAEAAAGDARSRAVVMRARAAGIPQCVLLDFGGTLDADGETWKARVRRLLGEEEIELPADRFDAVFHAADDALVGTIPPTLSFAETVRRVVAGVAAGLSAVDDALVERVSTRFVDDARRVLRRNASVLAALRARYRLGVVSNFYGNLDAVCAEVGLGALLGVIVDSARVGCSKPDPSIFRAALDALDVPPEAALFVGDSLPRDMAGARALGMPHVWLAGPSPVGTPCCPGDRVIGSLTALADVLR